MGALVAMLRADGFRFHHFYANDAGGAGELIYYRWCGASGDAVPAYSTSVEGVGCILLSPDQSAALLVWEYGHWKMLTGHVDPRESSLVAVRREALEEVGVDLQGCDLIYAGGWQQA